MKCIDVKSNAFKVPLLIWIITVLILVSVHPVKAEVGWNNFSVYNVSYYITRNDAGGINPNGTTQFFFDNANYTHLYQWSYNSTQIGTTTTGSDSDFTIVEGGIGSGYAFYTGTGGGGGLTTITWVCSGSCTISSSSFRILYSKQGFQNNFTGIVNGEGHTNGIYTDNFPKPVEMKVCNPADCTGASQYGALGGYYADTDIYSTTSYNVTYPLSGIFKINITKFQNQASTHTTLHDSTGIIYLEDPGFTKVNYTHINNTKAGIFLNVSVGTGKYQDILVNSTGYTPIPTPTPSAGGTFNPPLPIPSSGGSIQFNQTKYVVGDTVRVEWAISDADWNGIGQTFAIGLSQDNLPMTNPSGFNVGTQTGNSSWKADKSSTLRADLDGGFILATNTLASAYSSIVAVGPAYLSVQTSAPQGENVTIGYGFGNNNNVATGYITDVLLDNFGIPIQTTVLYTNLPCPCGSGSISKIFNSIGRHKISLWDATSIKVVATTNIQITASDVITPVNITSNSLNLDNTVYNTNDVIIGSYQISTANYTIYPYFSVALISASGVYANSIPIPQGQQSGQFQLPVSSGVFQTIQSGYGYVNLTAQSSVFNTTAAILASVNVTINANFNGYSVSAKPQSICNNDPIYVKYTGQTGTGILMVKYLTPALTTKTTNYSFSSNGTKVFVYDNGLVSDKSAIQFDIYDTTGNYQVGTIIKYQSTNCVQAGATVAPTSPPGQVQTGSSAVTSLGSNLMNLMSMPAFWGLLLFLGIIIACATNPNSAGSTGMVAFIFANIESVVGLWAPFTLYVLVITWIIAGIYFRYGRDTTTGVN